MFDPKELFYTIDVVSSTLRVEHIPTKKYAETRFKETDTLSSLGTRITKELYYLVKEGL